jgi:hypothetical protein
LKIGLSPAGCGIPLQKVARWNADAKTPGRGTENR